MDLRQSPALIVVDMQNGFCHSDGHMKTLGLDYKPCADVIEPIKRLLKAARNSKIPVIFTKYCLNPDYSDAGLLLELWPGNAHLHILWAGLVQLQEDPKHSLDEARQALQQAADLGKNLALPPFLEGRRAEIEANLKPL